MEITRLRKDDSDYPERLRHISGPPAQLYCHGQPLEALLERPSVAIVGSREVSAYGRQVTYNLAYKLAEQGVVIISGLAYGVDAIAHQAALEAGGLTIAVLPTPLDHIYPGAHRSLARRILAQGGALISEYEVLKYLNKTNFVARNRIVAGLADALLITEAAAKSGSLHTARFAMDQGQTVLAVPGPITSPNSVGTNNLLKTSVLTATSVEDILFAIGITPHKTKLRQVRGRNRNEQTVLDLLMKGTQDGDELYEQSGLDISSFNQVLTMLEINAKIRALGANQWAVR